MKLLTHNMLTSRCLKGVTNGYPLKIVANEFKTENVDYNGEFITRVIPKVDWKVLSTTASEFGVTLPEDVPVDIEKNEDLLRKVHHALLEIEITQGDLVCPETGRKFPIKQGIPNMLVNEDEVK
ncbi:uncharacterized protein LOC128391784 [Panonychus citri]|uniref:uncharacterized protein LOC128391784 n=1 Tax=Panonychus citri TaxID=50023 RepID=UPI0023081D35|nr:uncharacterized protein LOC128391784 [Panonychus citri]